MHKMQDYLRPAQRHKIGFLQANQWLSAQALTSPCFRKSNEVMLCMQPWVSTPTLSAYCIRAPIMESICKLQNQGAEKEIWKKNNWARHKIVHLPHIPQALDASSDRDQPSCRFDSTFKKSECRDLNTTSTSTQASTDAGSFCWVGGVAVSPHVAPQAAMFPGVLGVYVDYVNLRKL